MNIPVRPRFYKEIPYEKRNDNTIRGVAVRGCRFFTQKGGDGNRWNTASEQIPDNPNKPSPKRRLPGFSKKQIASENPGTLHPRNAAARGIMLRSETRGPCVTKRQGGLLTWLLRPLRCLPIGAMPTVTGKDCFPCEKNMVLSQPCSVPKSADSACTVAAPCGICTRFPFPAIFGFAYIIAPNSLKVKHS